MYSYVHFKTVFTDISWTQVVLFSKIRQNLIQYNPILYGVSLGLHSGEHENLDCKLT